MWKLLKYEFRRARTSLLTVLGVIAVLENVLPHFAGR